MKSYTATSFFLALFVAQIVGMSISQAQVHESSHHCQLTSVIQRYDAQTMASKSTTSVASDWFGVTTAAHEDPKALDLRDSDGHVLGFANVWTGTLLNTPEGDLIQAHASFTIESASGAATLLMSTDARLAKSIVTLDLRTADEFVLVPVELKCRNAK